MKRFIKRLLLALAAPRCPDGCGRAFHVCLNSSALCPGPAKNV